MNIDIKKFLSVKEYEWYLIKSQKQCTIVVVKTCLTFLKKCIVNVEYTVAQQQCVQHNFTAEMQMVNYCWRSK